MTCARRLVAQVFNLSEVCTQVENLCYVMARVAQVFNLSEVSAQVENLCYVTAVLE